MRAGRPAVICERVRAQISLQLDGELSDFEGAMLAAHLGRCSECWAYRVDIAALTDELRFTPLEAPERPVWIPRAKRIAPLRVRAGVAAAVAIAALGTLTVISVRDSSSPGLLSPKTKIGRPFFKEHLPREIRMLERVRSGLPAQPRGGGRIL